MISHWSTSTKARQLLLDEIEKSPDSEIATMLFEKNAPPEVWDRTLKARFYTTRTSPKECFEASRRKSIHARLNHAWALPRITWCFEQGHRQEALQWLAAGWSHFEYLENFTLDEFLQPFDISEQEWKYWWNVMREWNTENQQSPTWYTENAFASIITDILLTPTICNGLASDKTFVNAASFAIKRHAIDTLLGGLHEKEIPPLNETTKEYLSVCNVVQHIALAWQESTESHSTYGKYAHKNIHKLMTHFTTSTMQTAWLDSVEADMKAANDITLSLYIYECVINHRAPAFNSKAKKQLKQLEHQLNYWKAQAPAFSWQTETSEESTIPGILWGIYLDKIQKVELEHLSMFTNVFALALEEEKQTRWEKTLAKCLLPQHDIINFLKGEIQIQVSLAQRQTEDCYRTHIYWLVDRLMERTSPEESWSTLEDAIHRASNEGLQYPLAPWRAMALKIGYPNKSHEPYLDSKIKDACLHACIHALDHQSGLAVDKIQNRLLPYLKNDPLFYEQWLHIHMTYNARERDDRLTDFYIEHLCKEQGLAISLDDIRNAMDALGSQFDNAISLSEHVANALRKHQASSSVNKVLPAILEL